MGPAMTRKRAHLKSRSGCRTCRQRKVKCGEERPVCQNCTRRGQECEYTGSLPTKAHDSPRSITSSTSPGSGTGQPTTWAPLPRVLPTFNVDEGHTKGSTDLTVLDLELLHHYCISTAYTLSSDPTTRNYFLIDVPPLGFSRPYVLHSILALAASHLAHVRGESRQYYYSYAKARHSTATSIAAPLLLDISPEEAIPMHSFSVMTMFIAFGSLRDEDYTMYDGDHVLPSWLTLFGGVRTVLESNKRSIYSSSIDFRFYSSYVNKTWEKKQADVGALIEFEEFIRTNPGEDEHARQLLLKTFTQLRRALYYFCNQEYGNEDKVRCLFTWLYKIPEGFNSLLRNNNPRAMCVLGHFCVVLHRLEYNWWLQGWGTHLIERIYANLDVRHRLWVRWPIQQIGWIPKRESAPHLLPTPPTS